MGIFGAITELSDNKHDFSLKNESERIMKWFSAHLLKLSKQKHKEYYGISWFKSDAIDHIANAEKLCSILEENGLLCKRKEVSTISNIIYEDDNQVVTIEQLLLTGIAI